MMLNTCRRLRLGSESFSTVGHLVLVEKERMWNVTTVETQQDVTRVSPQYASNRTSNNPSPPQCLVFLHIPKVGGRTVTKFLKTVARARSIRRNRDVYNEDSHRLIPEMIQANRTFTKGHFTTRFFVLNPSMKQCYTLTVLREPVDRAISAFFYHGHKLKDVDLCLLNVDDRHDLELSSVTSASDEKEECKYDDRRQYSNGIVRQLAGLQPENGNGFLDTSRRPANSTHLQLAKQNLDKYFDAVCFLDDLPRCMLKVMRDFGISQSEQRTYGLNVTKLSLNKDNEFRTASRLAIHELDDSTLLKFKASNHLDQELYEYARSRYGHVDRSR